jgi:hypothetical protein
MPAAKATARPSTRAATPSLMLWLGLARLDHRARPAHQDHGDRPLRAGRQSSRSPPGSTWCAPTTPARLSASWPTPRAGSAGSSSAWAGGLGLHRLDAAQPPGQRLFCLAISLILGGAIGNVIDRLLHGYVVDFLQLHWSFLAPLFHGGYFPGLQHVADAAITGGAIGLIIDELLPGAPCPLTAAGLHRWRATLVQR